MDMAQSYRLKIKARLGVNRFSNTTEIMNTLIRKVVELEDQIILLRKHVRYLAHTNTHHTRKVV